MASKLVVDRQRVVGDVIASAETHSNEVAQNVGNLLQPFLKKDNKAVDIAGLMALLTRALAEANNQMVAADEAHFNELGDDAEPRTARDEAAVRLYDRLVEAREIITGLFGEASARQVGFDRSTPQEPLALARYAQRIADGLAQRDLGKPRVAGARFDVAESVAAIVEMQKELEQHLKSVDTEVREAEATLERKQQTMNVFDERFTAVTTVLEGLYRLAGKFEAADRIRPSVRRAGQTASAGEPIPPMSLPHPSSTP